VAWVRRFRLFVLVLLAGIALSATPALAAGTTTVPATTTPSISLGNASSNAVSTPETVSTPATTSTSSSGGGLSGVDAILIAVIAIGVLAGIWMFVIRDARRQSAGVNLDDDPFLEKRKGSQAPAKSRKLSAAERKRRKRGRAPRGRG
jgi:uncharacterized protein HemX